MSSDSEPRIALTPLRRVPLYEGVAQRLREFIATENLKPGDRFPAERVLAERLGVSRTSVRLGLTALRVMGLVDVQHGAGAYLLRPVDDLVPPITADLLLGNPDLPAAAEAGTALEAEAARLAASRRADADLVRMRVAIDQMDRDIQSGGHGLQADRDFHAAIVQAAQNPVLASMLRSITDELAKIAAAALARPGQPPLSLATHRLIVDAIEQRKGPFAGRLMRDHLLISGEFEPPDDR